MQFFINFQNTDYIAPIIIMKHIEKYDILYKY